MVPQGTSTHQNAGDVPLARHHCVQGGPTRLKEHDDARPLVSILTPSLNQGRWLPDTLHSVAAQTYSNIEHIVMDGGSTDGSVDMLRSANPRVRWWSEPDRGQSHALTKGFAVSQGDVIGWLSSDDAYFYRGAVADAVDLFNRYPEVDVLYGHAALVNADGLALAHDLGTAFQLPATPFAQFHHSARHVCETVGATSSLC